MDRVWQRGENYFNRRKEGSSELVNKTQENQVLKLFVFCGIKECYYSELLTVTGIWLLAFT